ncbi:hypothetical protein PAPYR_13350 [Paratrimastix pyriformis]|uniref:Nop domain-containing protein n=1 Tax=Paratrimastix pyriformis TaxID=342808 RepID=A0ABQ8U0G9_9EUKA|nr:hypothetical protein PAPYR_13350 [Paratrimastix pyriformis]
MAAATNIGKVLPTDVFAELLRLCEDVLALDDARVQDVLALDDALAQDVLVLDDARVQSHAVHRAQPVGPWANIAAKLMAAAGGLDKLSRIPACNLQLSRIPACNLQNPRIICRIPASSAKSGQKDLNSTR